MVLKCFVFGECMVSEGRWVAAGGYILSRSLVQPSYLQVYSIIDNFYFFDVSDAHMVGNCFVGNTHFRCSVLRSDA